MDNNETKPKKNIGKGLKIGIAAVGLCLILTFAWQCASCYIFPYKVEGKVWTYYVQKNGSVRLTGMNPKAVPADGVLYIPNKIGGRKVSGFGQITSSVGLPGGTHGDMFRIPRMEKVTLAKGVPVDDWFWGAGRIIELESKTAENIWFKSTQRLIIVPDGCRDVYITAMEKQQQRLSTMHRVVEKTESIGLEWLIDGDGLLKAYFGLQTEHLVFPEGIKKLDGGSLGGGGGF
ncbi:MAG: hypothetical protein FWD58_10135, partial [Firmicutes bacterium]|nr:hypothetical protein [Bacillota bacterium]